LAPSGVLRLALLYRWADLLHRTGILTIDCLKCQGSELDSQRLVFFPS